MLGSGTQLDPHIISTPQDLDAIRNNLTAYYQLANDIDMSGFGNFLPITKSTPQFSGHIDGNGYKIINLSIVDNSEYTAFIGRTNGGSISNLGLENVYVESNTHHLAGLVGLNYKTTISNCFVTGTIKNTNTSALYTGGLVGRQYGLIENSYTHCNVIGGNQTGGFVGYMVESSSVLKKNYSKSNVSGTTNTGVFYGGFNTTTGYRPTLENNFFDKDFAGTTNIQTTGVTAKTTSEMKTQYTYTGWDFDTVWYMDDYPSLRVFSNIPTTKKETINVNSYSLLFITNVVKSQKSAKQLDTFSNAVLSDSERILATSRLPVTYLSPINSSVTKSSRSVRSSTQTVTSLISPISASVERKSKTFVNLLSHIKPLQADLTVLYPMNVFTPNAYVSVLENTSSVVKMENMSSVSYIVNPSYSEVIE